MKNGIKLFCLIGCIFNVHGSKKRLRNPLRDDIESTARVRYAKGVILTEEQKRVLVSYITRQAHQWFKSPQRLTSNSIRCNEVRISNADVPLSGWFVDWQFKFRKLHKVSMFVELSTLEHLMKNNNK